MVKYLGKAVLVAMALYGSQSFACIGEELTEQQTVARKAEVVIHLLEATDLSVSQLEGVEFASFPTHFGMRGDCGALAIATDVTVQTSVHPGCSSTYEYQQFISKLFGREPTVRLKERVCN